MENSPGTRLLTFPPHKMDKGDHDSAGVPGGRGARCSVVRSHRFHIVAGIAVLLSLVTVGLVCLTIIRETSPTSPDRTTEDLGSRNNSEPFLLVADYGTENEAGAILQVDITSGSMVKLPLDVDSPRALDYDPLTDYVYWSEEDGYIKRARRDGSGMETIIDLSTVFQLVYDLALDHAGENIYWSDLLAKTISVAKKDGSSARTLLTLPGLYLSGSAGLVLDPRNRHMYWTDGTEGRIERAAMDGSNQTTISSGLYRPRAITIDFNEDRLYYSSHYEIHSSDLLGNDIRQLMYEGGKWVRGIAVDENFVYWSSDWPVIPSSPAGPRMGKIGKLSKSDLTTTVLVDGLWSPKGIYFQKNVANVASPKPNALKRDPDRERSRTVHTSEQRLHVSSKTTGCPTVVLYGSTTVQVARMTSYTMTGDTREGRPVYYSNVSCDFLYYTGGSYLEWRVGPNFERRSVYVKDSHFYADEINGTFFLYDNGQWRENPDVQIACSGDAPAGAVVQEPVHSTADCTRVRLQGDTTYQPSRMTTYTRTSQTSGGRPVYVSDTDSRDFLYFVDDNNRWVVGPNIGQNACYAYVSDCAMTPDQTRPVWKLLDRPGQWRFVPSVHATCVAP